jgi:hypothetical protein
VDPVIMTGPLQRPLGFAHLPLQHHFGQTDWSLICTALAREVLISAFQSNRSCLSIAQHLKVWLLAAAR